MSGLAVDRRRVLNRRIRWFVAATISYNVIEAVVAIAAGTAASSVALIGFGLDSVVEVLSAAAVAWQFAGSDPEKREKTALRIVAFSFFALAAYLVVSSGLKFLGVAEPVGSPVGLGLTALSLLIMPLLSYGQRRTGRELGSRSAVADSKQTLLCTYLSGVVFLGLLVNTLWGWTWADPVAALVIAGLAIKEGREASRGDGCCAAPAWQDVTDETAVQDACCGADGCTDNDSQTTLQMRLRRTFLQRQSGVNANRK
ncbi:cation transporter [Paenarthrobacter sp. PH39-S1]|uniref:cation diffusion facilitator family transporter n=1 Tax=Paenarthrobacter sp. PH39-S1 TaxID=3046204 RepID=UPI0024BB91BB|nr:cation transporter [Paenarthrobacter sp. PH39-S1]MDJ0356583.1 cation transporter [Paenarthrobacter sp. PH39-S1]